jgi:Tol biopolymer transport system component
MPSEGNVVSVNENGNVSIWALETGESTMYTLAGHSSSDPVDGIAFSFDGKFLATGMGYNTYVWEVETGDMVHKLSSRFESLAFSPDGKFVATDQGGTLHIWDMSTGQLIYKLGESGSIGIISIKEIAFSPDGENVAFVTDEKDAAVRIWSLETGQLIRVLRGHGQVESLAFSSDWKYVMTGSSDNIVRIWSMEMGQLVLSLDLWRNSHDWFSDVAFNPDGKYLVTVRINDGVHIWPFGTETLVEEAKKRIRRSLLDSLEMP